MFDEWQPIETAPKDGRSVLLLSIAELDGPKQIPPIVAIGRWDPAGDSWVDENGGYDGEVHHLADTGFWASGVGWFQPNEVTHWMPILEPPSP